MQQVAVRCVELDDVETGLVRASGGVDEGVHDVVDVGERHGAGRCVTVEGDRGRAESLPTACVDGHAAGGLTREGAVGRRLASGVRELDSDLRAVRVDGVDDAAPCGHLVVVPQAGVLGADAPLGRDGGGLRQHEPETTDSARRVVDEVPRGRDTVARLAAVLTHRREPDAVAELDVAQGEGFEQLGHAGAFRQDRARPRTAPRGAHATTVVRDAIFPRPVVLAANRSVRTPQMPRRA